MKVFADRIDNMPIKNLSPSMENLENWGYSANPDIDELYLVDCLAT